MEFHLLTIIAKFFGGEYFAQLNQTRMLEILPNVNNVCNFSVCQSVAMDAIKTIIKAILHVSSL